MSKIPGMTIAFDPYGPLSDDYLYPIELSLPKKQDVLQHLDANGPKAAREATAVVFHGSKNIIKEYSVGPLPNPAYHRYVTFERYKMGIPLSACPVGLGEYRLMQLFLKRVFFFQVSALVKEHFDIDSSAYIAYYDSMPKRVKSGTGSPGFLFVEMQRASTSTGGV